MTAFPEISLDRRARRWLGIGSVFGFLSIAFGAFGAHGLEGFLDTSAMATYDTAARYQMYLSLVLLCVGIIQAMFPSRSFTFPGIAFSVGILLFSGSLYALSLTSLWWFGMITPFGGIAILVGWVLFFLNIVRNCPA